RRVMRAIFGGRRSSASACLAQCISRTSSPCSAGFTRNSKQGRARSRRSHSKRSKKDQFPSKVEAGRFRPILLRMEYGSGIVLVVEDDDYVREFAVRVLKESGFRVLEAVNGGVALVLLEQDLPIEVLFTDIVM